MQQQIKYQRLLLKLSGEALMGGGQNMFHKATVDGILDQIKQITSLGVKLGIVIGGGNIFRGVNGKEFGLQRANADAMGILATIMNGIAFKDFLHNAGVKCKIYSALAVANITAGYNREQMLEDLDNNNVILFVAGTGNPYFTTDSGAALRAIDMHADLLIKATKVDGVYDMDPKTNANAKKYTSVSFDMAITNNLKIMDMSAFDLCKEHAINIEVCNIFQPNALYNSITGNSQGTLIHI